MYRSGAKKISTVVLAVALSVGTSIGMAQSAAGRFTANREAHESLRRTASQVSTVGVPSLREPTSRDEGVERAQATNPSVVLTDGSGLPKDGYWALQPDPASDPTGQKRQGRLRAEPPPRGVGLSYPLVMPVVADWESQQIDDSALFYLRDQQGSYDPSDPNRPRILSGDYPLNLTLNLDTPYLFADAEGFTILNAFNPSGSEMIVYDRARKENGESYTAQLLASVYLLDTKGFVLDDNSVFSWAANLYLNGAGNSTILRVLFRYFPDGTGITQLDEGEVALSQDCNYGGKATVFVADTGDFSKLTSSVITLDKSAASIRLGNNTAITLYSGAEFTGTSQVIKTDTPCLDNTPVGRATTSIRVSPLAAIVLSSRSCENCKLAGADFSGADLSGVDLQGADLSGATLTNADLSNANLTGANLTGANLTGTKLKGASLTKVIFDNATGIAGRDLTGYVLSGASLRNVDFSNATLTSAQLDAADLSGATLHSVRLNGANLRGAKLAGAKLAIADLTGADLTGANLTGATLSAVDFGNAILDQVTGLAGADLRPSTLNSLDGASLRGTDLSNADMTSVRMQNANLTGAKLRGANLTNALDDIEYLSGTDMTGADLTGANLTGVKLRSLTLSSAILDQVTGLAGSDQSLVALNGVSLRDVDLSNVKFYGANLNNANLEGANLSGAFLTNNSDGSAWTFTGQTGVSGNNSPFTSGNPAAPEGKQVAFIQRGDTSPSIISQAINITRAGQVRVKMQVAVRANCCASGVQELEVQIDDILLGDFIVGALDPSYVESTTNEVAVTAGTHTLKLIGKNPNGDDSTLFIDDVQVEMVAGDGSTTPVAVPDFGFEQPAVGDGNFQYNPSLFAQTAASLSGAHLKNVNLSKAQLSGANFTNASFYGTSSTGQRTCQINEQGFTQGCATASRATMNNTQFSGAYLYGVDFTDTSVQGVQFGNSVLIGANFTGATLSTDPSVGTESGFTSAFLQGANFAGATLSGTSLSGAFLDFRLGGNDIYLRLDGTHTAFPGWKTPGAEVCLFVYYPSPTTVPTTNTTLTCPDGSAAGVKGCGRMIATNLRWKSPTDISQTNPPASYLLDATYTKAATQICGPQNTDW